MYRYQPYTIDTIEELVDDSEGKNIIEKFLRCLLSFIYTRIAYQRKESIRTMVMFCNQEDTSSENLRKIIKSYFDESEKFTKKLNVMAEDLPSKQLIRELLNKIDGFDDVEHLYWETRRLLDERFRTDWAIANLFSVIYREGALNKTSINLLFTIIENMIDEDKLADDIIEDILSVPLSCIDDKDIFNRDNNFEIVVDIIKNIYERYSLRFEGLISKINEKEENIKFYTLALSEIQIKEVLNVGKYEYIA